MSRERIDTGGDKRYVRRDERGAFDKVVEVGRSLTRDRRVKAARVVKAGEGDRGDQKPRARRSGRTGRAARSTMAQSARGRAGKPTSRAKSKAPQARLREGRIDWR